MCAIGALARWLVGVVASIGMLSGQELTKLTPELAGLIRSLDPGGLDEEAVTAVKQW